MARHIDAEALNNPDLELITDYLAGELDSARVAEVRRRLDEDPAFRDFAAPIVAAWSIRPKWQREPGSYMGSKLRRGLDGSNE